MFQTPFARPISRPAGMHANCDICARRPMGEAGEVFASWWVWVGAGTTREALLWADDIGRVLCIYRVPLRLFARLVAGPHELLEDLLIRPETL